MKNVENMIIKKSNLNDCSTITNKFSMSSCSIINGTMSMTSSISVDFVNNIFSNTSDISINWNKKLQLLIQYRRSFANTDKCQAK